jgi:hypothetical protein
MYVMLVVVIIEVLTSNRKSKTMDECKKATKLSRKREQGSCFYIFFIYLHLMLTCALYFYVYMCMNKADKSTNKQHINCVCMCISRLLAHFSLPSFSSFVKRTQILRRKKITRGLSNTTRSNSLFSYFNLFSLFDSQATSSTYKSRAIIVIFRVHTVCLMPVYSRTMALKKNKRKNDSTHTH